MKNRILAALLCAAMGVMPLCAQTGPVDNGPLAQIPPVCTVGQLYFATDASAGQNLYLCIGVNTWTQMSGGGAYWAKTTISYSSVQTGSTTNTVSAISIPANATVLAVRIKEQTEFTGMAGTLTVSLGLASGTGTEYAPAWSLGQSVSATNMYNDGGSYAPTTASHTASAVFTSSSGNLSALTAGAVEIWMLVSVLPN
jgi:hypothetical protein